MKCAIKYSELYKQLIAFIIIPLVIVAFFIFIIYALNNFQENEMIFIICNLLGSVFVVFLGVFISRKLILINAEVEADKNGLHFQLENPSFLYNEANVSILYNDIQKISFGDNDNLRIYVKIKSTYPRKIIYVSPDKYENNDSFISYWNEIKEKIEQENLK